MVEPLIQQVKQLERYRSFAMLVYGYMSFDYFSIYEWYNKNVVNRALRRRIMGIEFNHPKPSTPVEFLFSVHGFRQKTYCRPSQYIFNLVSFMFCNLLVHR